MKFFKTLILTSMIVFFTGCGGGGSGASGGSNTAPTTNIAPQTVAIDIIIAYADDNTQPSPTVGNYSDAGITGVNTDNLVNVNIAVDALIGTDVDTIAEIQAVVDEVIATLAAKAASDAVLVQIGSEADDPDSVNSIVTVVQLSAILPALTDINSTNETAYQDYIDTNPDAFSNPATLAEVQAMIDTVNAEKAAIAASEAVLSQIGLEADNPNSVNSIVTVAQLGAILPALTDINSTNETAYQDYIDANPDAFASPATPEEMQAMVNTVNVEQAAIAVSASVLVQIGAEGDTGNTTNSVVTAAQLGEILGLTGVIAGNETAYQDYIDANPDQFSDPATLAEVQAMVDEVNAEQTAIAAVIAASNAVLVQIGLEADNPNTVNSVVTAAQLGEIQGLTGVVAGNETAYQDYIDVNPYAFSSPATLEEVQAMVNAVNAEQAAPSTGESNVTVRQTSVLADGTETSTITVTVKDANANPVTDATVTLAQNGSSTISSVENNNDGTYTFTVKSTTAETVTYTATATTVVITQTADVTFIPINIAGTLDTTFSLDGIVTDMAAPIAGKGIAVDSSDNVYVTGNRYIWKYTSTGVLDTTFGTGGIVTLSGTGTGNAIALDSLDNIYVTGSSTTGGGDIDMAIWKYKNDGSLDMSFGNNGLVTHAQAADNTLYGRPDVGNAIVLSKRGDIYVTGSSERWGTGSTAIGSTQTQMVVWRCNASGGSISANVYINDAFSNNSSTGYGIVLDESRGFYYVTGQTAYTMATWKYSMSGVRYGPVLNANIYNSRGRSITLDTLGNIYVTGYSREFSNTAMTIWKYKNDKTVDNSFGSNGVVVYNGATVGNAIKVDKWSDNIYVTGNGYLWKYTNTGALDSTFGTDGIATLNGVGNAIAFDNSGAIYVTGASNGMTIWKYLSGIPSEIIALDKIQAYANDNTQPSPTVEDYVDAGITGVNAGNLTLINTAIDALVGIDVDTVSEIQAMVDSPIADAGANQNIGLGTTVILDGSSSYDNQGDTLTYSWQMISKPTWSNAILNDTTVVKPTFIADREGDYVLELTVNDGKMDSTPVSVTINANQYTRENEIVTDHIRGLMWQDNIEARTMTGTWAEAVNYCNSLTFSDYTDWYLPSESELMGIGDKNYDPAIDPAFVNVHRGNYTRDFYWTSTPDPDFSDWRRGVMFYSYFSSNRFDAGNIQYVRCVRNPSITIDKIKAYADDNTKPAPTVQDYFNTGVTGVDTDNINYVNIAVDALTGTEVDTVSKIQAMIDTVSTEKKVPSEVESDVTVSKTSVLANGTATSTVTVIVKDANASLIPDAMVTLTQNGSSMISTVTNVGNGSYTFTVTSTTAETVTYTATADTVGITRTTDVTFSASNYTRENEIVTEHSTGLMWQDDSAARAVTKDWTNAINYCQALTLGDYTDWYLPSESELMGIGDANYNPAIDPAFVYVHSNINSSSDFYWTSTTDPDFSDFGRMVMFYYYFSSNRDTKTLVKYVRCVRNPSIAIDRIKAYADANTKPAPTLQDYFNVGVTGVDAGNLSAINASVDALTGIDIDTVSTIQTIVDEVIDVMNTPVADAGADQNVLTSTIVTLDGNGSSDGNHYPLTYFWSFTSIPAESNAFLSDDTAVNPTFIADVDGDYVLSLIVDNGIFESVADTVTINATTENAVFIDYNTGLKWADLNQVSRLSVSEGHAYCSDLIVDNDSDWRLPSHSELANIINFHNWNPAVNSGFRNISDSSTGYWSSTYNGLFYYYVNFYQGGHDFLEDPYSSNPRNIICVSNIINSGTLDTTFSNDGIVMNHNAAGGNGWDTASGVALDSDGNIYVTGYSMNAANNYDMVIWKYNSSGVLDTTFDGDGMVVHDGAAGGNKSDYGYGIVLDSSGNIYVTGKSLQAGTPYNYDMVIWKYNSSGVLDTSFDGDGIVVHSNAAGGNYDDLATGISLDSSGNIYVTGSSTNSSGTNDMVIWKYNSNGILDTTFDGDGIVVHNSAAGGNSQDAANGITLDSNGNIYVTGYSTNAINRHDMVIWKYNSSGVLDTSFDGDGIVVHNSAAGGNSNDDGSAVTLDSSGNIYVTGNSTNLVGNNDMVIWKYNSSGVLDTSFDSDGIVVHNSAAGGNNFDSGKGIVLDSSGNIYIAGFSVNTTNNYDMVIWKYNSNGILDTTFDGDGIVVYDSAVGGNDNALGLSIDRDRNIYTIGKSDNALNSYDMVVLKYK